MKHDRAIHHIADSDDELGPFCAICHYSDLGLGIYRGEWWCEVCVEQEELFDRHLEATQ